MMTKKLKVRHKRAMAAARRTVSHLNKQPNFIAGLAITVPSLVVDESGKMWWVHPEYQTIKAVKVT